MNKEHERLVNAAKEAYNAPLLKTSDAIIVITSNKDGI